MKTTLPATTLEKELFLEKQLFSVLSGIPGVVAGSLGNGKSDKKVTF